MAAVMIMAAGCFQMGHAQSIRIYDRTKDDAAQKALEAAKKVASGSLFEAELKNLDALAKLEIDSTFAGEARVQRNFLNQIAVGTWRGVDRIVNTLKPQLDTAAMDQTIAGLQADCDRLQARLTELKAQKPAPAAAPVNGAQAVAELIGKGIDADHAAAVLAGGPHGASAADQQAIDLIGKALAESKTAGDAAAGNKKQVNDTAKQLSELQAKLGSLAMDRLKIELDHCKTLLKIWQRAAEETRQTQKLITQYEELSRGIDRTLTVTDTIQTRAVAARAASLDQRRARRNDLDDAVGVAFMASEIAARWNSASLIGQLREAHETHLYSIRRSRLEAQAFEIAVGSGAQRLALFYKGGTRPEVIAQILYAAATASLSGVIAATK